VNTLRHLTQWTLILALPLLAAAALTPRSSTAVAPGATDNAPAPTAPLLSRAPAPVPLPEECGGVNPPGQSDPACCAYGYVYYDGAPLAGADVTLQGPGGALVVATEDGPASADPYFSVSLSDPPLQVGVSDTITLSVSYAGRSQTLAYQVVAGGQQIDLALPTHTSDTPIYYVSGSNAAREIWRMNGDGSGRTYIRDGWDPDMCPINGDVLYITGGDIWVMDINGDNPHPITTTPEPEYNPDWSPDCSQIVYMMVVGAQYRLFKMNADGSNPTPLPYDAGGADDWYPEWSPNGQWIAFTSTRLGDPNGGVYRINTDGSDLRQLTPGRGWFPVWSPDSSRIAYVGLSAGVEDVFIMNADGSGQWQCTQEPTRVWWPYWLSDDRLMYVTGDDVVQGTHLDIYVIQVTDAGCTNPINLTDDGNSYYRSPTVRPTYAPIATLHSIRPGRALTGRDSVTWRGSGQDADEVGAAIAAYRWTSDLDGLLSTQAAFSLSAAALSTGTHSITLQVQDDEGDWSPAVTRTLLITDQPFDMDVLILTHREQLAALYGEISATQVISKASQLALETNGLLLQVEDDPAVAAAYADWLAHPTSVEHANAVAQAIHALIVRQLEHSPDLAYLVIVGDDRVLPFYRAPDHTSYSERYYDQIPASTTVGAALEADYVLTDDFYADRVPTPRNGRLLTLPDRAIGRLVETPAEIIGQIDRFLSDAPIAAQDTLVTGYDIVVDSAQRICSALIDDDLFPDCTLIGNWWTATQFLNLALNQRHDLASLNGHADHHTLETPAGSVSSAQVHSSSADHSGALFWSPGCHLGLNAPPETPVALDLVQALVGQEALVVGNTGYGYAYQYSVGLSEQLMLNYTRHLLAGVETTAGRALVDAKQQYFLEELHLDEYDEKVLVELTFYGLPMTRVTSPDENWAAAAPFGRLRAKRPEQVTRRATLEYSGALALEHLHYGFPGLVATTTPQGVFYSLGGRVEASDAAPVQPRYSEPLSATGGEPHGAVLRGAVGQEIAGMDPVIEQAKWEIGSGGSEPAFDVDAWSPGLLLGLNRIEEQSQLSMGLGQFHGLSQTQRIYAALDVELYRSDSDDWEAPQWSHIESELQEYTATVTVWVSDASGIQGVVVAYTAGGGDWSSIDLALNDGAWTGEFSASAVTGFLVQMVDQAGNVRVYPENGRYMRPGDQAHFSRVFLPALWRGE